MMAAAIRVLYVDDDPSLLDIGKLMLEQSGDFTVTTALSAPEGYRLLEQEKFDAVISDYQMPEMDGIQFLVEVRTRFGLIPFILFTGKGREDVVIQAINRGADFYLQKCGDSSEEFAELSHKLKQAASWKMADDVLKKNEETYRHVIGHSDEAIVVVQDGMLKMVNHRAIEFTGYSEQELLSMQFPVLIHPDDRLMMVERYQQWVKGEELPYRYTFRLSPKDRSTRWVELNVAAIDWDGHPATLNFLTDITERKQTELALRESEERYRSVVEDQTEFICRFTPDGILTFVNNAYCRYFSLERDQCLAHPHYIVLSPEESSRVKNHLASLTPQNPVATIEHRILMPSGEVRWQRWSDRAIFDKEGHVIEYQSVGRDITEQKKAEEKIKTLTRELESRVLQRTAELENEIVQRKAAEAAITSTLHEKEVLLREIHHRVKNNLQIITSLIRLQRQQITDVSTIHTLQDSESRIRSMSLVHEKLYSSADLAFIDFSDYIDMLATNLMITYATDTKRIHLNIDIKNVSLDINRAIPVGLIMNELLTNALKHAFPKGQNGEIAIIGRRTAAGITLSVQDNGVGLPDGLDWKNSPTLGLHLILTLIQQLEGSIELNRTGGTGFEMTIPLARKEPSE
ncbi:PAS domain S-box protein [Methanoregula sp.]|jgi:PAS domain S-box-containing protein|uniref:PAS domain S-box protein n=1 Tax=Methanoregula sp. TaxID=2052170 RepID=UPI0035634095